MDDEGRRLMAGNSQRRGAKRTPGSKKGSAVGSGGKRSKGLTGRGPTPKATERKGHPAARRKASEQRRAAEGDSRSGSKTTGGRPRRAATAEYVAGRNAVLEALRGDVPATAVYVASRIDSDDRVREALKVAGDRGLPVMESSRTELDRLTNGAVHQGLVLQVPPYEYAHPDDLLVPSGSRPGIPLVVALDGVTDPRNLGAVVRSAAAFGAHGVVVPERRSAGMTASAWKTSAGAAVRVPVARATNLARALAAFQKAGYFVVGLDADGSEDVSSLTTADSPLVLVVGSEGAGLSRLVREACDVTARIPMVGGTESLNAGVAAGVALYAIARQRDAG
jgi:23S rRNA (guanosine2251-2'-O)-methyltransferase